MVLARSLIYWKIGMTSEGLVGIVEDSRVGRSWRYFAIATLTGDGGGILEEVVC